MALITCPECQQQVSDQATVCPNCGFPLSNSSPAVTNEFPEMAAPVTHAPKKKKLVVIITSVVCILLLCISVFLIKKNADAKAQMEIRAEYIKNMNDFLLTSLDGGAMAEDLCNLTYDVWRDTIYKDYHEKTAKYTKINNKFREDFNDSLNALYADPATTKVITSIKANQTSVNEIFKKLSNPPEEFQNCYDMIDKMFSAYRNLTELAISPSGSLNSYSESARNYAHTYLEHFDKLKLLVPEN